MNLGYKKKLLGVIALLGMFSAMEANAQSQNMNVSANVPNVCVIQNSGTALQMAFGDIIDANGNAQNLTQTATISWKCTNNNAAEFLISPGSSTNAAARTMAGTTNDALTQGAALAYTLTDPLNANWGDTTGNGYAVTGSGMSAWSTTIIDGTITSAAALAAPEGAYSDVVTITLNH